MTPLNRFAGRFGRTPTPISNLDPEQEQEPIASEEAPSASLSREEAISTGVLTLGHLSYGEPIVTRYPGDTAKVWIGKYCSMASGVEFMVGGNHRPDWVTTYPLRVVLDLPGALTDGHPATKGDIIIGNDVWIGADARILSGVNVGDGAVIGMGAIVASNVQSYAVMVGNPAREVRRRFSDSQVDALRRIAWWDWPDDIVRDRVEDLCSSDIDTFIRRFDQS